MFSWAIYIIITSLSKLPITKNIIFDKGIIFFGLNGIFTVESGTPCKFNMNKVFYLLEITCSALNIKSGLIPAAKTSECSLIKPTCVISII